MLKWIDEIRITPLSWLKAGIYACAVVLVYYSALTQLVLHDWAKGDYSHCMLIPFVVLYLFWEKRHALISLPSTPSWSGLVPLFLGFALFWLGELGGEVFTMYISLYLVIVGLSWLHLGWKKVKTAGFAFIMMLAMFPFPNFINVRLSLYLKLLSSQLGVWLLHLYGMSAYREGNIIDLGFTQLQVADACSGLRYLIPLMILALILAHWFKARLWKRVFLFLTSIPVAVFVNSFRIALTGVLYSILGPAVAEEFFHGFSGWLIFLFTLGVLLIEMWILKKIGREGGESHLTEETPPKAVVQDQEALSPESVLRGLRQPRFLVTLSLLLLILFFSQGIEFRGKIPIAKPLNRFPLQVGQWTGTPQQIERQFIEALDFSDYTMIDYSNHQGQTINLYIAYYESQRKGESIHSPETCLPGSGWDFREADGKPVVNADNRSFHVTLAYMTKGETEELVYYWFPQRGRILTSLYQLKFYAFWDALTKQRTDGALIRIITPVYPAENRKTAEARLHGFTREIAPLIDQFIPGSDVQR
ncbi:MAG TPA: VPLPA-CTERM-specific exosortase XrtD [Syntrophales bacterium]|nr:VPLPA-CTERM-specific exosortase XrtD [Syntrophales bacterium]